MYVQRGCARSLLEEERSSAARSGARRLSEAFEGGGSETAAGVPQIAPLLLGQGSGARAAGRNILLVGGLGSRVPPSPQAPKPPSLALGDPTKFERSRCSIVNLCGVSTTSERTSSSPHYSHRTKHRTAPRTTLAARSDLIPLRTADKTSLAPAPAAPSVLPRAPGCGNYFRRCHCHCHCHCRSRAVSAEFGSCLRAIQFTSCFP